ncbi:MAG: hypothetical protein ACHQRM_10720 [Bacteroidia bacterium]
MKTRITTIICLSMILYAGRLFSQSSAGIVIGASTSSVKLSDFKNTAVMAASGQGIKGFEGGVYAKLGAGPLYIKPMLLAGYQAGQLNINYQDGSMKHADFKDGKMQVPVLFGLRLFHLVGLEAGPVYNWMFGASENADGGLHLEQSGLGYWVGANVLLGALQVGLAYQGLTNISSSPSTATYKSPDELILDISIRLSSSGK